MKKRLGLKEALASMFQVKDWIMPLGVIRRNDLVATRDYEKAFHRAVHCVGRVWLPGEHEKFGTGFLVGPGLLLTNQHVLSDQAEVERAVIWFEYDEASDAEGQSCPTARGAYLLRSSPRAGLDYALVQIEFSEQGREDWEPVHIDLRDTGKRPRPGEDRVIIVQHPNGGPRQIVTRDTTVIEVTGRYIRYEADTDEGSSGAPVFDLDYRIVGLHHAAYTSLNEAIGIEKVLAEIEDLLPA